MQLTTKDLACHVGGRIIVSHVNLTVPAGTMMGLVGVNGSGKSTLIRALCGLRKPAAGAVFVDGVDLATMSGRERATKIAILGQEEAPTEDLLVGEMVAMGRIPHRPPWAVETTTEHDIVAAALATVGMSDKINRRCDQLSGGERRRAMLARALAQDCELLVLDEPTNHLDIHHQIQLLETIRGLGKTVIAAIHDLALARTFFDHIAVLDRGRILVTDTAEKALSPQTIQAVFGVSATRLLDPSTGQEHLVLGPGVSTPPAMRGIQTTEIKPAGKEKSRDTEPDAARFRDGGGGGI